MQDCQVSDRICVLHQFATIRYIGPVSDPSISYLGLQWDDSERGKHQGTMDGISYFQVVPYGDDPIPERAASFVRADATAIQKALSLRVDFLTALEQKYAVEQTVKPTTFGDSEVPVMLIGFEKVEKKQRQLDRLLYVALSEHAIAWPGKVDLIATVAPNIEELDLSKNLLHSWQDISSLCAPLRRLEKLILSHNRFSLQTQPMATCFNALRVLVLSWTGVHWQQMLKWASGFPALEELHLCGNKLRNLTASNWTDQELSSCLSKLKVLDLENNQLSDWTSLQRYLLLLPIETLKLNENRIQTLSWSLNAPLLQHLNLDDNLIQDWKSIDALNSMKLTSLRIARNPLVQSYTTHERLVTEAVARVSSLTRFNGSIIPLKERLNAERYYLLRCSEQYQQSKVNQPELEWMAEHHPRYEELCKIHGAPVVVLEQPTNIGLLEVSIQYESHLVQKRLPGHLTVRQLKGMIRRWVPGLMRVPENSIVLTAQGVELDDPLREWTFYATNKSLILVQSLS